MREYFLWTINVSGHQLKVAKTYMWLSAATISALIAAIRFFPTFYEVVGFSSYIPMATAILVLVFSLQSIRARARLMLLTAHGWGGLLSNAYDNYKSQHAYADMMTDYISDIIDANEQNKTRSIEAGKWLLASHTFLLITVGYTALNLIIFLFR